MRNMTKIIAMPPQNSTLCGRRMTDQIAAGGQETVASRNASMQASTPERNPVAVAILRFLSGVIWPLTDPTKMARALLEGQPMAAVPTFKKARPRKRQSQ
jgi:hypothetical protein